MFIVPSVSGQDDIPTCVKIVRSQVKKDARISILKKDQQEISGYLRSANADSITIGSLPSSYFGIQITSIDIAEIETMRVQSRHSFYKQSTANQLMLVGGLTGATIGFAIEKSRANNSNRSANGAVVIGAGVAGALVSYLLYRVISSTAKKVIHISCVE